MFSESAEFYDLIYDRFKDYRGEAEQIAALLGELHPDARTLLDVGCGTGQHARFLTVEHGFQVDGLDIEPLFVQQAQARCPEGTFFQGDMSEFDLARHYDVVLCLFSSIGYVRSISGLEGAARSFFRHTAPAGVAIVEPWFTPEKFLSGSVYMHTAEDDDLKVCRASRSEARDRMSVIEFQYLVVRPDEIRHLQEVHELGLFTATEMRDAFEAAGFQVIREEPEGLTGDRGLLVARKEG